MKHPDTSCDHIMAASPLAVRWRCPVDGKTAITKVSILAAICDGETHAFHLEGSLRAFEGANEVCRRDWNRSIPRDLM